LQAAQEAFTQADPATMVPLREEYRDQLLTSDDGGVAQRWRLLDSAPRRAHSQRPVDQPWLNQRERATNACQQLCRMAFAWEAEAQPALGACAQGLEPPTLHQPAVRPIGRYAKRGRPGQDAQPAQVVYQRQGALASSLATREASLTPHRGCLRATNELDEPRLSPQERLDGDKGQSQADRGLRCRNDPRFFASSLSLKKPERIMALLMVMTVCLFVDAALESRLRTALTAHEATVPEPTGKPSQHPTARWVFQYLVGIHLRRMPGEGAMVLHLNDEHRTVLRLLGKPYLWCSGVEYS
jgi:hypothetical protein